MFNTKTAETSANHLATQAAASAEGAIQSTQRVANEMLDGLATRVQDARDAAAPLLHRAVDSASALEHRGIDALHEATQRVKETARDARNSTVDYIRDEPVKSVLIAAGIGAAIVVTLGLLRRD